MNTERLERCKTFINAQLQPAGTTTAVAEGGMPRRAVTISRQTGSGAHSVAEKLAVLLQAQTPKDACPWTVFDRNLVEKVLDDHHLPQRLAGFMPEDRVSEIKDTIDELFGLHPPSEALARQTSDTILRLAELGNVILIGRGATVLTRKLDYVFHVRLVGSVERRAQYIQEVQQLSQKAALERILQEDLGRKRYLKRHFDADIDDPLLYHLVINTDLVPYEEAAQLIATAVLKRA
jgi:cytidylate kinase